MYQFFSYVVPFFFIGITPIIVQFIIGDFLYCKQRYLFFVSFLTVLKQQITFFFLIYGEDRSIYLCKKKKEKKKKLSLNIGATPVGHGCQTPVNKTKEKFHKFFFLKKKKIPIGPLKKRKRS